ncbi:MAG: WYL domain-containing protein [Pseudomonadota bacterium]
MRKKARRGDADEQSFRFRDTAMRYLAMAQLIPREPQKLSAQEIADRLKDRGYKGGKRTIERDLAKLSEIFMYTYEADGRSHRWFYPRNERLFELPGMSSACALALLMARDYLVPLLPAVTLDLVKPYFLRAESVLQGELTQPLAGWLQRIRVITPGLPLDAPKVSPEVQDAVYRAVLEGKQLQVEYKGRGAAAPSNQLLHPQGLVLRDGVVYLVAAAWSYEHPVHYALHRFRHAECLAESSRTLRSFDFATYVEQEFRYPVSPGSLHLQLRVDPEIAAHLEERPLGKDQRVQGPDDGGAFVSATVADTDELRWWLLSFGAKLEVLKPLKLRRELARTTAAMAAQYAPATSGAAA